MAKKSQADHENKLRNNNHLTNSKLELGEEVEVVGKAPVEECDHEMFVMIRWKSHEFAVPLIELEGINVDEETQQAIEDWHYWVDQGYEL